MSNIKDEKALEDYILEVGKIDKKFKKRVTVEFKKLLQEQREKTIYSTFQRFRRDESRWTLGNNFKPR